MTSAARQAIQRRFRSGKYTAEYLAAMYKTTVEEINLIVATKATTDRIERIRWRIDRKGRA